VNLYNQGNKVFYAAAVHRLRIWSNDYSAEKTHHLVRESVETNIGRRMQNFSDAELPKTRGSEAEIRRD
jgi:hypothetical protein